MHPSFSHAPSSPLFLSTFSPSNILKPAMLEVESLSVWSSMYNWLTPNVIFIFLNLIIGTIAISTSFSSPKPVSDSEPNQKQHTHLSRSQSVLQKFKSLNFYNHFNDSDIETRTAFAFQSDRTQEREDVISAPEIQEEIIQQPEKEEEEEEEEELTPTMDEIYMNLKRISDVDRVNRLNNEPIRKMKRWESTKTGFGKFDENVTVLESRRPATMREGRRRIEDADAEVDSKADDFINNFKNQLKLQKMESIMRF